MDTGRKYIYIVQLHSLFLDCQWRPNCRSLLQSLFLVRQWRLNCRSLSQSPFLVRQRRLDSRDLRQNLFHTCLHRWIFENLLCLHSVRLRSQSSRRILDVTIGSRFGTNVHAVTVCLTAAVTTLLVVLTAQHEFYTDTGWRSDHWTRDSWHSSHCRTTEDHWKHDSCRSNHWRTSVWRRNHGSFHGCDGMWNKHIGCDSWDSSHWKTFGCDQKDEHHHDHTESQWFTHAFFEALSVDQLINSLHRGEGDTTTFTGLVSRSQTLLHKAGSSISVHFERQKRLSSTSLD